MAKVGNGRCNPECLHERTGQDGGDCDLVRLSCDESNIGNGRCDAECNRAYHGWDGGDCCDGQLGNPAVNCFDPASLNRCGTQVYISVVMVLVVADMPTITI